MRSSDNCITTERKKEVTKLHSTYCLCKVLNSLKYVDNQNKNLGSVYKVEKDVFDDIVKMDDGVNKSHQIHACWLQEQCSNRNGHILHGTVGNGCSFVLNSRKEGYPPRRG